MNNAKLAEGTPEHTSNIRELNDQFRKTRIGGRTIITAGLCAEGPEVVNAILEAVAAFDAFSPENDPWDEHDCAIVSVLGIDALWHPCGCPRRGWRPRRALRSIRR